MDRNNYVVSAKVSHRRERSSDEPFIIVSSSPVKLRKKQPIKDSTSFSEALRLNKLNLLGDKLYNLTTDNKKIKPKKKKHENEMKKRPLFEKNSMRIIADQNKLMRS